MSVKTHIILLSHDIKLLNEKYIEYHNLLFAQKIKRRRCEADIQVKLLRKILQSITICILKVIIYKYLSLLFANKISNHN